MGTEQQLKKMLNDLIRDGDKGRFSSRISALEMNLKKSEDKELLDDLITLKKIRKLL